MSSLLWFFLIIRTRNEKNDHFRVSVLVPAAYFLFLLFIFVASFLKVVQLYPPPKNAQNVEKRPTHFLIWRFLATGQMYFVFCLLYPSPQTPRQCLAPTCHLSTLNLQCIAEQARGRACLSIWLERFRGTQSEDERVGLGGSKQSFSFLV
jgi:hypothetical protein